MLFNQISSSQWPSLYSDAFFLHMLFYTDT